MTAGAHDASVAYVPPPLLDHLTDGVLVTDAGLDAPGGVRIVYANPAICEMTGYTPEELLGKSPSLLQGPDTERSLIERLAEDLRAGRPFKGEGTNYRKDGSPFTMEWTISVLPGPTGEPEWFIAIQRDATEPARRLLHAQRAAHVDALTGLPNRRHMDSVLRGGAWLSSRTRAALVLDLDRFKVVNDTYGHVAGDEVLREVGRRLRASVRTGDLVARWGGEEFCVLALGAGDIGGLAQRMHAAIRDTPVQTSAGPVAVTVSVGCASVSEDLGDAQDLLRAADAAMYSAKREGRDRVCRG